MKRQTPTAPLSDFNSQSIPAKSKTSRLFIELSKGVFALSFSAFVFAALAGCSSGDVKKDGDKVENSQTAAASPAPNQAPEAPIDPSVVPPPGRDRILESYSYIQLTQAASAYKIVSDETIGKGSDTTPPNIFGCEIDPKELKVSSDIFQNLIEAKLTREQTSYLRGPKTYLKTRMGTDCTKTCTCGAILDVLSSLDVRVLNKAEQTRHEELLLELQSKSAKQGPDATMECAKQQKWICKSDLQKYLKAATGSENQRGTK